jgi:hypothetical protein
MLAAAANARLLVFTLLNGEVWSAEFLPHGGAMFALAGLAAVAWFGARKGKKLRWRAFAVVLLAITMFAPCLYVTFLWNRLRYLWPFATGWIVGLACLARAVGDLAGMIRPRWRVATAIVCGVFVGMFASKLGWVLDDVAQSASGIERQQVALGRWAKANLPTHARIGVNDTGAIAYFGDRKTFDVVGLTTQGEARYWVSGVGSRFEHYERLRVATPEKLPTHFIVYPEWMALDSVLGPELYQATVTDSTILGGQTMRVYLADWSALGSGEQPWSHAGGQMIDSVDVADLESESEHEYELLGARDGDEVVHEGNGPDGSLVVDAGRARRKLERFVAHLHRGLATHVVVRLDGNRPTTVRASANGEPVGSFDLGPDDDWVERSFDIPPTIAGERTRIELSTDDGLLTTFHYWFVVN